MTTPKAGYSYSSARSIASAQNFEQAITFSVWNYMHDQLGWSEEDCYKRTKLEIDRVIPKTVLRGLDIRGWKPNGKRVLDLGSGQGGLLIELLLQGADAFGIEPSEEFFNLTRLRLASIKQDIDRVIQAPGECLPFPDGYFDCVISLQVLEHVPHPLPILEEIKRVLKPGGVSYITCENYLSFYEPHYRVRWFPMLPKKIGARYLRRMGRNPQFLEHYIFYTTYPQIWRMCKKVGFHNETYRPVVDKFASPDVIHRLIVRSIVKMASLFPVEIGQFLIYLSLHTLHVFKPGLAVFLRNPLQ